MSLHKSLKVNKFAKPRNVRKRYERLAKLIRNVDYMEKHMSVYGLPKEKIKRLKIKIKEKKEEIQDLTQIANKAQIQEKK